MFSYHLAYVQEIIIGGRSREVQGEIHDLSKLPRQLHEASELGWRTISSFSSTDFFWWHLLLLLIEFSELIGEMLLSWEHIETIICWISIDGDQERKSIGGMILNWKDNEATLSYIQDQEHIFFRGSDSREVPMNRITALHLRPGLSIHSEMFLYFGCSHLQSFRDFSTSSDVLLDRDIRIGCTRIVLDSITTTSLLVPRSQIHQLKTFKTFSETLSGLSSSPLTSILKLDYDVMSFSRFDDVTRPLSTVVGCSFFFL